ncbi:MAG TPA: BMC domain-containing protein [Abditibacteriaceae bacterium]|nr:BMC domain-containing protein [Abditibacteriaceae bacterium]
MTEALGLLEIIGLTPAMVALDTLDKTASVRLLQVELNDFYGVVLKITGATAAVQAATAAGHAVVESMGGECISTVINAPDAEAWKAIESKPEFNPLLEAYVVRYANYESVQGRRDASAANGKTMENYAIGLIETQGFTAVFEAIDAACKAANVQVIGKEKLGGGYVTVLIKGDVAAVNAAVETGRARVEGLGKLIAAHVIPRPSEAVLSLIPK